MLSGGYGDLPDNGDISRLPSLVLSGMHKMMWYNALSQKPTIWHADGTRQSPPKKQGTWLTIAIIPPWYVIKSQHCHYPIRHTSLIILPAFSHSPFYGCLRETARNRVVNPQLEAAWSPFCCCFYSSSIHWKGYGWYLRELGKRWTKKGISENGIVNGIRESPWNGVSWCLILRKRGEGAKQYTLW